ncbi:MAG: hypothetical protein H6622_10185 [Halobacteriovoraceae bacterium]|nr:hypothetical protein [Halobacteriovoraceae bacterium]
MSILGKKLGYYAIHEVQPGETLSQIIVDHFKDLNPKYRPRLDWAGIKEIIEIVQHNNPEIKDPDKISTWQIIDLSLYKKRHFEIFSQGERTLVKNEIRNALQSEVNYLNSNSHLFSFLNNNTEPKKSEGIDWIGLGLSGALASTENFYEQYSHGIKQIQDALNNGHYTYKGGSNNFQKALQNAIKSGKVKQEISKLSNFITSRVRGEGIWDSVKSLRKTVVIPDYLNGQKVAGYLERSFKVLRNSKYIKPLAGWGVEVVLGIGKVWTEKENKIRVAFGQGGNIVLGGLAAQTAAYVTCNMVFSLPTAGTSGIVCGFVVAGLAGAGGSYYGEKIGGGVYDGGKFIYDTTRSYLY